MLKFLVIEEKTEQKTIKDLGWNMKTIFVDILGDTTILAGKKIRTFLKTIWDWKR